MRHEIRQMMRTVRRSRAFEAFLRLGGGERTDGPRDLFAPLDDLLVRGGDPRVTLDPVSRVNDYGCGPSPAPEIFCFASSTASPISERAHARAALAREELMRSSIELGFEEAYDARIEALRDMLRAHLRLSATDANVVFSPSGTDSQLHALFLARALLGEKVTTIVVGSDQTGSGTVHTARGRHFSARTANGKAVDKDAAIAGLSGESIALPLYDGTSDIKPRTDIDAAIVAAVETAITGGAAVLLQIMDSSKLGWRAPGETCLDEVVRKWPGRVQVVVDACQMRLGRRRMQAYLDRGYMVLVTGSKYFGGPAFSGALLVPTSLLPTSLSRLLDDATVAPGLLDYASRSDWPKGWTSLRARFRSRLNFGQWLRWEAALAEMGAYDRLPDAFRARAVRELSAGLKSLITLSPSLRLIEPEPSCADDEEFSVPTIFPFTLHDRSGPLSAADGRKLHRALMQDLHESLADGAADRDVAACRCLIGQPVALQTGGDEPIAALRLCVGARHVIDAWSADAAVAEQNLLLELDRAAHVVAKIEWLLRRAV
jgi:hypothetical protein